MGNVCCQDVKPAAEQLDMNRMVEADLRAQDLVKVKDGSDEPLLLNKESAAADETKAISSGGETKSTASLASEKASSSDAQSGSPVTTKAAAGCAKEAPAPLSSEEPQKAEEPQRPAETQPAAEPAKTSEVAAPALGPQEARISGFLDSAGSGKKAASFGELRDCLRDVGLKRRPSSENITLDAYVEKHASEFKMLEDFVKDARWQFRANEQDVDISQFFDPKAGLTAFKATTTMDLSKKLPEGNMQHCLLYLLDTLLDITKRPQWDDMCTHGDFPEQRIPFYRLTYCKIKPPAAIISARDILLEGRLRFEEDGRILIPIRSCTHPDRPEEPGFVRVDMKIGGYILEPTANPKVVRVTWCGMADANGWLPGWLKNMVAWKQGLVLAVFKKNYGL
eukprot:TRINITY_DN82001_c0_g1_i1.p1 TRINITY_DN82001_c0_g1~~TRINITY_DN82001_c0_g1_i1.p1  ORF type:complete len:394 (-),score=93.06 TRINITY_DN82001_c0_g1_i1:151-1332(-)